MYAELSEKMCARCAPRAHDLVEANDFELPNKWLCLVCRVALTDEENRNLLARPHAYIMEKLEELKSHLQRRNVRIVVPKFTAKTQQYYRVVGRLTKTSEWTMDLVKYNAYTDDVYLNGSKKPLCKLDYPDLNELVKNPSTTKKSEPRNSRKIWYPFSQDRYPEDAVVPYEDMKSMLNHIVDCANRQDDWKTGVMDPYGWKVDFPPGKKDGKQFINITNTTSGHPKYYIYARIDAQTGHVYTPKGTKPYCSVHELVKNPHRL